jgi:hypothetical protein
LKTKERKVTRSDDVGNHFTVGFVDIEHVQVNAAKLSDVSVAERRSNADVRFQDIRHVFDGFWLSQCFNVPCCVCHNFRPLFVWKISIHPTTKQNEEEDEEEEDSQFCWAVP